MSVSEVYGLLSCGLRCRAGLMVESLLSGPELGSEFVEALQLWVTLPVVLLLFGEDVLFSRCYQSVAPVTLKDGTVFATPLELAVYHSNQSAFDLLRPRGTDSHGCVGYLYPDLETAKWELGRGTALLETVVGRFDELKRRGLPGRDIRNLLLHHVRKIVDELFPGENNMNLYKRFMSPFTMAIFAKRVGLSAAVVHQRDLVPEFEQTTGRRSNHSENGPKLWVSERLSEDIGPVLATSNPVVIRDQETQSILAIRVCVVVGGTIKPYLLKILQDYNQVQLPSLPDPRPLFESEFRQTSV